MIFKWRELSGMTKVFYIAGLVSAIGVAVMVLSGKASIWDAFWLKYKICPWSM